MKLLLQLSRRCIFGQSFKLFQSCKFMNIRSSGVPFRHKVQFSDCKLLVVQNARNYTTNQTNSKQNSSKEIYYGILTPQIYGVKVFSMITSLGGLAAQPILYHQLSATGSTPAMIGIGTIIGFFTFVTPFLLHMITKKYVTRLYFDDVTQEYSATLLTFFMTKKNINFTPDDVVVPDIVGMFTSFTIKGTPVFVDFRLFEDPSHYGKIMGYYKPMNFGLSEITDKMSKLNSEDQNKKNTK